METSSVSFVSTPQNRYGSSDREAALVGASELVNGLNDAPGNPVLVSGVGEPNLADREVVFVSNAGPGAREGESHDLFELCMQAIDERRISQDLVDRLNSLETNCLGEILGQQNQSGLTPLGYALWKNLEQTSIQDLIELHNREDLNLSDALLRHDRIGYHVLGSLVTQKHHTPGHYDHSVALAIIALYEKLSPENLYTALEQRFNNQMNALSCAIANNDLEIAKEIVRLYCRLDEPKSKTLLGQTNLTSCACNLLLCAIACAQDHMGQNLERTAQETVLYTVFDLYIAESNDALLEAAFRSNSLFKCKGCVVGLLVQMATENNLSLNVCEAIKGLLPKQLDSEKLTSEEQAKVEDLNRHMKNYKEPDKIPLKSAASLGKPGCL